MILAPDAPLPMGTVSKQDCHLLRKAAGFTRTSEKAFPHMALDILFRVFVFVRLQSSHCRTTGIYDHVDAVHSRTDCVFANNSKREYIM